MTVLGLPGIARAIDKGGNNYAAVSVGYAQGDFGTSEKRRLYSLTPEFGRVTGEYELSASIPLHSLHVEGDGQRTSESGLGDIVLRAGRRLWQDAQAQSFLNGSVSVKLATGDEDAGLGTGATDVGATVSAGRKFGDYSLTALLGYVLTGDPAGVDYDNAVLYGIGVNRRFSRANVFASVQGQSSVVPGGDAPIVLDLGFFRLLTLDHVVIAHAFLGLSDGSPDGGVGLGLVRWF